MLAEFLTGSGESERMRKLFRLTAVLLSLAAVAQGPAFGQPPGPINPQDVLDAISSGVAYLKNEQAARGHWDQKPGYAGGVTGLATLALLNSGVPPADPVIQKALGFLRGIEPDKTYCIALKIMVLAEATPDRDLATIQQCADQLVSMQNGGPGNDAGGWSYSSMEGGADPSNSQFALLALHEAARVGARVPQETWRAAAGYWRRTQNDDGSWAYGGAFGPSGSMTSAGIASLVITSEALEQGDARVQDGRVRCCVPHEEDERVERALAWMGRNFSVRYNPGERQTRGWHLYYLYALERVGRMTAHRYIGKHDWYREGTAEIVREQEPLSNYWTGGRSEQNPHIGTAMALLFLSKGRRPVLMAKMDYGEGWNTHRHDAMHLTRVVERAWRMNLTWQQLDPRGAAVEDLLQAPVIYLSGSDAARLTPHAQQLRAYVDRGGFIFAEGCCGDPAAFRQSFDALIAAMFPEPEYRLRQLRPAHPVWRMERPVRPESAYNGALWSVEYGCRTCVMYCQEDLSCYWELNRPQLVSQYPPAVQARVKDASDIGLNVLAYATGRKPLGREQVFVDDAGDPLAEEDLQRGVLRIAKLQHGGGCNDAPGALANLTRVAAQGEVRLRVAADAPLIALSDPALFEHTIAFIHGRHDFKLTAKERDNLRQWVDRGGTLLGDSICASEAFTRGFRRELSAALPGARLQRVPPDDPILTTVFGGYDVRTVSVRNPQPVGDNQPLAARLRQGRPVLEGIKQGDRWAVIFSPFDLSCALERHEAVECRGYSREDAARIGLNVLLYALNY